MNRDQARTAGRQLLGDRIEKAFKTVGIHQTVKGIERLTGWDCGCAKRTAALNAWDNKRRS
ncbi:MAG: hypothetical protein IPP10_14625 [Candidatus Competibacteraceae bacterium]|jgi:hypothetical protein|nr:hypothetical protein [Candidatus Competibacteraceae bacterium]MBK7982094.1 hypothetical protein [Candidatus Competibacteraceae bacterium]MBK8963396.1 hypothetical protein [Candidatus Competibacteraceae bacterium]MBK9952703.1 hypothetical protein [Candidatus Competibacteraceae bacterium]